MKRTLLLLLLAFSVAMAQGQPVFPGGPEQPIAVISSEIDSILKVAIALMFTMVVLAATVYVGGQFFGAETRAKATVWAQGMLVAVGISAAVLAMLYLLLPGFSSGKVPDQDFNELFKMLSSLTQTVLGVLAMLFVVLAALVYAAGNFLGVETRARANAWATGLIAGAIVAAVIYVLIFQLVSQFGSMFLVGTLLGNYAAVLIQIVFFVTAFILVTYLLSKFFHVPEWEAYLNIELSNLMGSFLIVVFILALFFFSSALSIVMSGGTAATPPQAAIEYMQGTVVNSVLKATMDVYSINACTSMLSTISRRIGEAVLTQTYKIFPGLDTFVSITNMLGFTLVTIYATVAAQVDFLYLIDATMQNLFLPAGLVLRFIPPTRDAGAFLISLAIGLQIIFPTTYIINKQIFEDVGAVPYKSPTLLIQSICGPFKYGVAGFLLNPAANPIFGLIPGGKQLGATMSVVVSEGLLNMISMAEFIPIMRHIASLSLLGLFIPALSMMVTIAFINAMTKFIVSKV